MTRIAPGLLDVEALSVRYGGAAAVRDVSFSLAPGQAFGIVGESGSGKSSIAGAVLGLLDASARVEGSIRFEGQALAALSPRHRRTLLGRRIGAVFQDPFTALNPALRVGRQIAEPLVQHLRMPAPEARRRVLSLLSEMGIARPEEVARAYPHQLSGGMKQRALIAAALACEPALLILDEPTTALDVTVEAQILALLAALRRRHKVGVLFISHNLGVVRRVCDDVAVMYASEMVELGRTAQVLARPAHPYSRGLLASLPKLRPGARGERLPAIPGQMAEAPAPEAGCVFAPRCPFAEARCTTGPQRLLAEDDGRRVRCWKAAAVGAWPVPAPVRSEVPAPAFRRGDALVNATAVEKHFARPSGWFRRASGTAAVAGVSLAISPGEVLGLVGESGCGKSTLGRLVLRLLRTSGGTVEFDGRSIADAPERTLRQFRGQAQIVFQNVGSSLNPRRSIGQALARPLALFGVVPRDGRARRVEELLAMVRLPAAYAARYPHQLSGGERQRVAIARALASGPRFIVCDEPVSALDVSVQAAVVNLLADLRDRLGLAYLFISHDLAVVAQLADRIAVMYRGRICESGPTGAVLAPPYHPYTATLLASAAHEPAPEIARIAVDARGCGFRDRCPHRMPICAEVAPPLRPHDGATDHAIACHLARLPGAPAPDVTPDLARAGSAAYPETIT